MEITQVSNYRRVVNEVVVEYMQERWNYEIHCNRTELNDLMLSEVSHKDKEKIPDVLTKRGYTE